MLAAASIGIHSLGTTLGVWISSYIRSGYQRLMTVFMEDIFLDHHAAMAYALMLQWEPADVESAGYGAADCKARLR